MKDATEGQLLFTTSSLTGHAAGGVRRRTEEEEKGVEDDDDEEEEEPADSSHTPLLLLPRGINEVLEESWKFRGWGVGGSRVNRIQVALRQNMNTCLKDPGFCTNSANRSGWQNPRGFKTRH